jgi:hypothetical protein
LFPDHLPVFYRDHFHFFRYSYFCVSVTYIHSCHSHHSRQTNRKLGMVSSGTNGTSAWYLFSLNHHIGRSLHFWVFLIFDLCAIVCTVFVLYHLLSKRKSRKAIRNHTPILLLLFDLVYELIDIPLHLQFFRTGVVRPATRALCLIWWFIDSGLFSIIAVLIVFASFERHIFIFHSHMVATKRKRLLFHYFPLLIIVLFMLIFYSIAIFAPICDSTFDYTADLCGTHACYNSVPFFGVERTIFGVGTGFLIFIVSMTLILRFICRRYRIQRYILWQKQRKLAVQVISMSLLYLIFMFPLSTIYLVRLCCLPNWADETFPIFFYLSYLAVLLIPFAYLAGSPKLWNKVKRLYPRRRRQVRVAVVQSKAHLQRETNKM